MSARKSIIYIAPNNASFVAQDIEWLSRDMDVSPYFFHVRSKLFVPWLMLRLSFFLLVSKRQSILVSFGGYHSLVAALVANFKRSKCFIILNGTDSASIPEYAYGHLRGGILRFCCKKSYEWCTQLLPVSKSLMSTENSYAFEESKRLGVLEEFPNLKTSIETIHNGFNASFWKSTSDKKPNTFITVVGANRLVHKGIDLIIELARKRKEATFFIAGVDLIKEAPENVIVLGYLNREELRDAYSKSEFYLQLSIWEGFGCALCEAMLCGCIPIVSDVNILPEIAGDQLLVLKKRSARELGMIIEKVQKRGFSGAEMRKRIELNYSIRSRIELLQNSLDA
jgi:glycosyltransferase involved in cell wall biosynthesis